MKKVLIIADQPNWCFGRRAAAIQNYAPEGWDVRIEYTAGAAISEIPFDFADLVLLLDPHLAKSYRQYFNAAGYKIPLVAAHNSGPGRPGYGMDETLNAADYVIVNNHAAWSAARFGQREYRACNISNGVDLKAFFPESDWADRPNRALWIGSIKKSEDKDDVKGFQTILSPLSRVLEPRLGISPDFRTATPTTALDDVGMREFYNTGRYLVVASKSEGTPNIALEAAACGCAVITTPVGNMPELIVNRRNGIIIHRRDTVGFMDAFEFTPPEQFEAMAEKMLDSIKSWDWSFRAPWYFAVFKSLIEGVVPKPFSYLSTPPAAVGV